MKYVILAAGKGTRLRPKTINKPKPLVEISDRFSILETHLKNVESLDWISEIIIITGYKHEKIREKVKKANIDTNISCVYNPYYNLAGPLGSVWSAYDALVENDFILCNGDTVFHNQLIKKDGLTDPGINLVASKSQSVSSDDLKIKLDENLNFDTVGKNHNINNKNNDRIISAGMVSAVGEKARTHFGNSLSELITTEQKLTDAYWHSILNNIPTPSVNLIHVDLNSWVEIDDDQDLLEASENFSPNWIAHEII